jgi:hypothetical protein
LKLFQQLIPAAFLDQVQASANYRPRNRVYTPLVVLWLMTLQRLNGGVTLQDVIVDLLQQLPASFWPRPCKRVRDWQENGTAMSANTGAYNQARQALPLLLVQESCDRIFNELIDRMGHQTAGVNPRAFILDGSSMRMAHTPSLIERFPPGSNTQGEAHWPVLRVLVAHDLQTGLAMRPEWGPMYGPNAVGEQQLLERALHRLPGGSILVGDANFGVFSVAWAGTQSGHPVLLRMTPQRAQRLAGGVLSDGMDLPVVWKPSRDERRTHPELPDAARVQGRLIVRLVRPDNGARPFLLSLFTTVPGDQQALLDLYGQRWRIETDLRSLKRELQLDQLTCATPDMAAKEIDTCIAAYNFVRAVTSLASAQSGLPPRSYGFTAVRRIVNACAPAIIHAGNPTQARQAFDRMMHFVQQAARMPRRQKRPSYPRAVWNRGGKFPHHKP